MYGGPHQEENFGAIEWFGFRLLRQMIELCTGTLLGEAGMRERAENSCQGGRRKGGDLTRGAMGRGS